jgi:hypothetical protein
MQVPREECVELTAVNCNNVELHCRTWVDLDRFEGRNRAGSGLVLILKRSS